MTSVWQLPALIGAILTWLNTAPVSLADAARHEAVRRALLPAAAAVYTNDTLPMPRPSDVPAPPEQASGEPPPVATTTGEAPPKEFPAFQRPPEPDLPASDDESAWRGRFSALQATLERNRTLAAALESRVAALKNDVLRRDDPAQRAALAQELSKALAELDRMSGTLQSNQTDLDKLRDEARRSGVPPGWLRP